MLSDIYWTTAQLRAAGRPRWLCFPLELFIFGPMDKDVEMGLWTLQ